MVYSYWCFVWHFFWGGCEALDWVKLSLGHLVQLPQEVLVWTISCCPTTQKPVVVPNRFLPLNSQNHRMISVGWELKNHLALTPLPRIGIPSTLDGKLLGYKLSLETGNVLCIVSSAYVLCMIHGKSVHFSHKAWALEYMDYSLKGKGTSIS